jgi:hypothetical protein
MKALKAGPPRPACAVCVEDDATPDNILVTCKGCRLLVHQGTLAAAVALSLSLSLSLSLFSLPPLTARAMMAATMMRMV